MTLQDLINARQFMKRLATLAGGMTNEVDCFAFTAVCAFLDSEVTRLQREQDAQRIEKGVKAALDDLQQQVPDGGA